MANQRFDVPSEMYNFGVAEGLSSTAPIPVAVIPELKRDSQLNLVVVNLAIFRPNVLLYLDFRYYTGPRAGTQQDAAQLSDKFDRDGYVVLGQDSTGIRIQFSIGGLDPEDPYTYNIPSRKADAEAFMGQVDPTQPFYFELWDEEPAAQPTPEPLAPTTAITDNYEWEVVLHDALQHLAENQMPILRERVFPDVLPEGADYTKPHLVWYQTGQNQTQSMEGSFDSGIRVSLDFRSQSRFEVVNLRKAAISYLRNGRIIDRVVNTAALYDFETKIRRDIVDVIIYPTIDPQKSNLTRISPWASPWGHQFG